MKRALSELLRVLAGDPEVLDAVRQFQSALMSANQGDEWIDQYRSPLRLPHQKSSKRHCQLVRERIARLGPNHGAFISPDEKQFFLTSSALCEEMTGSVSVRPLAKAMPDAAPALPVDADTDDGMLRLIQGGRP